MSNLCLLNVTDYFDGENWKLISKSVVCAFFLFEAISNKRIQLGYICRQREASRICKRLKIFFSSYEDDNLKIYDL